MQTSGYRGTCPSLLRFWLAFHATVLLGYALLGRGFAYIGIGHVYIGEMCLGVGMLWLARFRQWPKLLHSKPIIAIFALQFWGVVCTVPYVEKYGINALRDAMLWGYSWFANIVAAAVMSAPYVLDLFIRRYRSFSRLFLVCAPVLWLIFLVLSANLPHWPASSVPVSGVPIIDVKPAELLVQSAGVFCFFAVGLGGPFGLIRSALLVSCVGMAGAINRGGLISFVISALMASVLGKTKRVAISFLVAAAAISVVMLATDFQIVSDQKQERPVSPREILINLISTVTSTGNSGGQQDTKEWRMAWWRDIYEYTVEGPYFVAGKGYGINLADSDGYQTESDHSLRSPHNSHLTFLARSGVPGFVLWIAVLCTWFLQVSKSFWRAHRLRLESWAALFLFVICYVLAELVNASFDPALEGPMLGIWFWSVMGLGIGASIIFPSRLSSTVPPE